MFGHPQTGVTAPQPEKERTVSAAIARSECGTFFISLAEAQKRLLVLDYDGTIAPFRVNRREAVPYAPVPELIDSIHSTCHTRVVLVTGRSAREVGELLGLCFGLEVWGVHGLERLHADGRREFLPIPPESVRALAEADDWLDADGLGGFCELKPGAVAVHWRGRRQEEVEEIRTRAYRVLAPLACEANLLLSEFDGGLELRARAGNKGHALRTLLSECGPETALAYLGDDFTDEDAFREVNGRGLSVLVRQEFRSTQAQAWLKPPGELVQFLNDWIRACGGDV